MLKEIKNGALVIVLFASTFLAGCQNMGDDLGKINNGLSTLTGKGIQSGGHISNQWNVSDTDAMAWLSHNNITWSNDGKLKGVNWYTFWAQQIYSNTSLANQAHQYCSKNSWETPTPGANCKTFFEASEMNASQKTVSMEDYQ